MPTNKKILNLSDKKILDKSNLVVVRIADKSKYSEYVVINNYTYSVKEVHEDIQQIDENDIKEDYIALVRNIYEECSDLSKEIKASKLTDIMKSTKSDKDASVFTFDEGQEIEDALNLIIKEQGADFTCELYGYSKIYPEDDLGMKIQDTQNKANRDNLFDILKLNDNYRDRFDSIMREIKESVYKQCEKLGFNEDSNPFLTYLKNVIRLSKINNISNAQYVILNNLWAGKAFNDTNLKSEDSFLLNPNLYQKSLDNFEFIIKAYYWLSNRNNFRKFDDEVQRKYATDPFKLRDRIIFGDGPNVYNTFDKYSTTESKINSVEQIEKYIKDLEAKTGEIYTQGEDEEIMLFTDKSVSGDNLGTNAENLTKKAIEQGGNAEDVKRIILTGVDKGLKSASSQQQEQK